MDETKIEYDSIDFEKVRGYMIVVDTFGEFMKAVGGVDLSCPGLIRTPPHFFSVTN